MARRGPAPLLAEAVAVPGPPARARGQSEKPEKPARGQWPPARSCPSIAGKCGINRVRPRRRWRFGGASVAARLEATPRGTETAEPGDFHSPFPLFPPIPGGRAPGRLPLVLAGARDKRSAKSAYPRLTTTLAQRWGAGEPRRGSGVHSPCVHRGGHVPTLARGRSHPSASRPRAMSGPPNPPPPGLTKPLVQSRGAGDPLSPVPRFEWGRF